MLKKLVKHGNSYALVIERPILEILNINPEDPVRVSTDGRKIMVQNSSETVMEDEVDPKLSAFLKDMDNRYGEVLQHLA